jgi:hypothetical protein
MNGQTSTSFQYEIPAKSSRRFVMSEIRDPLIQGSVRIVPDGVDVPSAFALLTFVKTTGGIQALRNTQAQTTVPAQRLSSDLRAFVLGGDGGFIRDTVPPFGVYSLSTFVALTNGTATPATVDLELENPSKKVTLVIPPNGQLFQSVDTYVGGTNGSLYSGPLRISASTPISAMAFQFWLNEEFPFAREPFQKTSLPTGQSELPHLPRSTGYQSSIIVLRTDDAQASSGVVSFYSQAGEPVAPR